MSDHRRDAALRAAVAVHFDPDRGSPFWLERERELGIDARAEIQRVGDLGKLGPFQRAWLVERPLRDFVPRAVWRRRTELVLAETGGTTGRPVRTVFGRAEFVEAFVDPLLVAGRALGFPEGATWLFVGPSGPHAIGQAARELARGFGSLEPFSVDLDPRFARAQEPGSLGEAIYRDHVLAQALDIMDREPVDVLFTTPPICSALARELEERRRQRIRGIHLGGMAVSSPVREEIEAAFPSARLLLGYGNSMFGVLPELPGAAGCGAGGPDYHALGRRIHVAVVRDAESLEEVAPGRSGRVCLSRFDQTFLLPNVVERDEATAVATPGDLRARGFCAVGVRDPRPVEAKKVRGLY